MPKGVYERSPEQLERLRDQAKKMREVWKKALTRPQLEMAANILNFDIRRKGAVNRAECPKHGRDNLTYLFYEGLGVKISCKKCEWTTRYPEIVWEH